MSNLSFKEWMEVTKATIYTQSSSKGATVDDAKTDEPIVMLNIDDIVNYEQATKMLKPVSQRNMQAMVAAIKAGQTLPPIMVREVENLRGVSNSRYNDRGGVTIQGGIPNSRYKYQVVDGHHRYWAYKMAGVKQVAARIIAPENISREKHWSL